MDDKVSFSLVEPLPEAIPVGDRWVRRKAKIAFRAADYPDKNFSINGEELRKAVEHFNAQTKSLPFDLEHIPTILEGKLGAVVGVQMNPDGASFSLDSMIPKWLHEEYPSDIPVSAQFHPTTKLLKGFALTRNPRVDDAKLLASFSMDMASAGPMPAMPPSGAGAPPADNAPGGGASHGADLFKKIISMLDAAEKDAQRNPAIWNKSYLKTIAKMKQDASEQCNPQDFGSQQAAGNFNRGTDVSTTPDPRDTKIAQLEAELKRERQFRIQTDAVNFAHSEPILKRFYPTEEPDLIALYVTLAQQDSVNFSANPTNPTDLLERFKKQCLLRREHGMTREQTPTTTSGVVDPSFSNPPPNKPGEAPVQPTVPPERRRHLLSKTEMGRKILADEDARAGRNGQAAVAS